MRARVLVFAESSSEYVGIGLLGACTMRGIFDAIDKLREHIIALHDTAFGNGALCPFGALNDLF